MYGGPNEQHGTGSRNMSTGSYLIPRLKILKQNSLNSNVTIKDGVSRTVHTVVKNSPFLISIGLDTSVLHDSSTLMIVDSPTSAPLNLTHVTLDSRLLYDNNEEKEVDFVKHKPLEFKVQSINEQGTEATVECRLKVLTSQLEDMLFRIKLQALLVQNEVCFMTVVTDPIKVISKPERPPPDRPRAQTPGKRRTNNDILLETLTSIHQRQTQQQEVLQKLTQYLSTGTIMVNSGANPSGAVSALPGAPSDPGNAFSAPVLPSAPGAAMFWEPAKKKYKLDDDRPLDFDTAFRDLMDAFDGLQPDKRPEYMRNFILNNNTSPEELSELHDMFSSEGLGRSIGMELSTGIPSPFPGVSNVSRSQVLEECNCDNCPHRNELTQLENFYKELFFS